MYNEYLVLLLIRVAYFVSLIRHLFETYRLFWASRARCTPVHQDHQVETWALRIACLECTGSLLRNINEVEIKKPWYVPYPRISQGSLTATSLRHAFFFMSSCANMWIAKFGGEGASWAS